MTPTARPGRARGRTEQARAAAALLLLAVAVAVAGGRPAEARERILAYHADIEVGADGTLTVREMIRVQAEGDQIKRGIYRDFPTLYRDRQGGARRVPFDVLDTRRDGQPEPRRQERLANGTRTYLGQADVFLAPGPYTYTIVYRTARQLGLFADHDELYWNVTGNDWTFVIERATATVTLPGPVAPGSPPPGGPHRPDRGPGPRMDGGHRRAGPAGLRHHPTAPAAGWADHRGRLPQGPGERPAPHGLGRRARVPGGPLGGGGGRRRPPRRAPLLRVGLVAGRARSRPGPGGPPLAAGGLSPAAVRYVWRRGFDDRTSPPPSSAWRCGAS